MSDLPLASTTPESDSLPHRRPAWRVVIATSQPIKAETAGSKNTST